MERRAFLASLASALAAKGIRSNLIDRDPYSKAFHDFDPTCPHCAPKITHIPSKEKPAIIGELIIISGTLQGKRFPFHIGPDGVAELVEPFPSFARGDELGIYITSGMQEAEQVTVTPYDA